MARRHTHSKKTNEDKNTMLVFTFFAGLVAITLVIFILAEVFNHQPGNASPAATPSNNAMPETLPPGTPVPATTPGMANHP